MPHGTVVCSYDICQEIGRWRCSSCKLCYYCSSEHQKLHWKTHRRICRKSDEEKSTQGIKDEESTASNSQRRESTHTEQRRCRCMFCGTEQLLGSEEEAIEHMQTCTALQEQLSSPDPITVPKEIKKKYNLEV